MNAPLLLESAEIRAERRRRENLETMVRDLVRQHCPEHSGSSDRERKMSTFTNDSLERMQATAGSMRTCATCKYKEKAGMMVDPCFPCLQETSLWTGEPKAMYDAWVDENSSWEEIEAKNKETEALFEKIFNESPALQAMKREIDSQNVPDQERKHKTS